MPASAGHNVEDGDRIKAEDIGSALTAAALTYTDGATQTFTGDGRTTFTEQGRPTDGEWGVDDHGRFWSFWPPSYRAEYELQWIVEANRAVGIRFRELGRGSVFEGRYA